MNVWWWGWKEKLELIVFSKPRDRGARLRDRGGQARRSDDPLHGRLRVECGSLTLRCCYEQEAYQALDRSKCAAQQESYPNEAFAAMFSEPYLPNP
jgi:hypothetical protein